MELVKEDLGKVAITVEKDYWDITKAYDRLVIVEVKSQYKTYISRQPVPTGVAISNRDYWIPFSSLQEEATAKVLSIYNRFADLEERVSALESIVNPDNDDTEQVIEEPMVGG